MDDSSIEAMSSSSLSSSFSNKLSSSTYSSSSPQLIHRSRSTGAGLTSLKERNPFPHFRLEESMLPLRNDGSQSILESKERRICWWHFGSNVSFSRINSNRSHHRLTISVTIGGACVSEEEKRRCSLQMGSTGPASLSSDASIYSLKVRDPSSRIISTRSVVVHRRCVSKCLVTFCFNTLSRMRVPERGNFSLEASRERFKRQLLMPRGVDRSRRSLK